MRPIKMLPPLSTVSTVLFLALLSSSPADAKKQTVDVALRTSFPAPPFFLELLEAAAQENSSSYFPILSSYAQGGFSDVWSPDQMLFTRFQDELEGEHLSSAAAMSSWSFAVATRSAAPKVEAAFQFWRTAVAPLLKADGQGREKDGLLVFRRGGMLCADTACEVEGVRKIGADGARSHTDRALPFDHVFGDASSPGLLTLYADLANTEFPETHGPFLIALMESKRPFRLRYKPRPEGTDRPLFVNGYGVELALKRTDYIVIDDRQEGDAKTEKSAKPAAAANVVLDSDGDTVHDLKPLASSELSGIALKAASFIMGSEDPFDTLLRVSQDFPKHAASLASRNISSDFLTEHHANRETGGLQAGSNVMWMNGMHIGDRSLNAFSLLEHMRRERKLIQGIEALEFEPHEAVSILTHPDVAKAQSVGEPQRYDYRDESDGGNIIMWLNNIEKDKRYAQWSNDIQSLLQRTFPGQLPSVRKDIHNVVFPVDLTSVDDISLAVEQLQVLVKRTLAVRFGIVPTILTPAAKEQAKIVYYLQQTYGLRAVMDYLTESAQFASVGSTITPEKRAFDAAVTDRKLRDEQRELEFSEVLASAELDERIDSLQSYLSRLGADGAEPPIFGNGVAIPNTEDWMATMGQRVGQDLRQVQEAVFENQVAQNDWIPDIWLANSSKSRNPIIIPEDESNVKLLDVGEVYRASADMIPALRIGQVVATSYQEIVGLILVVNLASSKAVSMVLDAIKWQDAHTYAALVIVNNPDGPRASEEEKTKFIRNLELHAGIVDPKWLTALRQTQNKHYGSTAEDPSTLLQTLGFKPGENGVFFNGRVIGPIPEERRFEEADFDTLLAYERKKRIDPVIAAVKNLGLEAKLDELPLATVELSSLVALASVSDVPEGIFDNNPGPRMDMFNKWSDSHTCIEIGTGDNARENATLQIVATIDPASETAQRWIPMIGVLSKLSGVHARIFLNPLETVEELPVKRFYREVLNSEPMFSENGALEPMSAVFSGIPQDALLTMNMDVPPSWMVAPSESVHDLDNLKLSTVKDGSNVEAIYELEHILVEGHSRDTSMSNQPPRGVQLLLGTETKPDFDGTIIMANLGYFQFKANPGMYNLALQSGRSRTVYSLDSAGTSGWAPQAGDESTEICLTSFQGATVFPRLSRKPGMEKEDVLEADSTTAEAIANKGAEIADDLLAKAGLGNIKSGDYIAKGLGFGQNILSKAGFGAAPAALAANKQADINIFSVASGHLYERMLNIMMVSVMRHTHSSVKFWFIEQFLSPSFKRFLPHLAAEYGFAYEMVTYKWPHWLRAQKEKQRVIWGYKILFLDVLFPLDLDKVIFVDADQIVRTDMLSLVKHDLQTAPYGFTPMCDSREEMEGFRFWKQGYWKNFLRGMPYHISALYVVDLRRFRALAAGDRLRGQYHQLSADPNSLANLDQDLPNHMQMQIPIHSLPQDWLWCETWCSDEALLTAKTIDLCNNPLTKEPKLDRARRQVPEWTTYDDEIAALVRRVGDAATGAEGQGDAVPRAGEKGGAEAPPAASEAESSAKSATGAAKPQASKKDEL